MPAGTKALYAYHVTDIPETEPLRISGTLVYSQGRNFTTTLSEDSLPTTSADPSNGKPGVKYHRALVPLDRFKDYDFWLSVNHHKYTRLLLTKGEEEFKFAEENKYLDWIDQSDNPHLRYDEDENAWYTTDYTKGGKKITFSVLHDISLEDCEWDCMEKAEQSVPDISGTRCLHNDPNHMDCATKNIEVALHLLSIAVSSMNTNSICCLNSEFPIEKIKAMLDKIMKYMYTAYQPLQNSMDMISSISNAFDDIVSDDNASVHYFGSDVLDVCFQINLMTEQVRFYMFNKIDKNTTVSDALERFKGFIDVLEHLCSQLRNCEQLLMEKTSLVHKHFVRICDSCSFIKNMNLLFQSATVLTKQTIEELEEKHNDPAIKISTDHAIKLSNLAVDYANFAVPFLSNTRKLSQITTVMNNICRKGYRQQNGDFVDEKLIDRATLLAEQLYFKEFCKFTSDLTLLKQNIRDFKEIQFLMDKLNESDMYAALEQSINQTVCLKRLCAMKINSLSQLRNIEELDILDGKIEEFLLVVRKLQDKIHFYYVSVVETRTYTIAQEKYEYCMKPKAHKAANSSAKLIMTLAKLLKKFSYIQSVEFKNNVSNFARTTKEYIMDMSLVPDVEESSS